MDFNITNLVNRAILTDLLDKGEPEKGNMNPYRYVACIRWMAFKGLINKSNKRYSITRKGIDWLNGYQWEL